MGLRAAVALCAKHLEDVGLLLVVRAGGREDTPDGKWRRVRTSQDLSAYTHI